MNNLQKQINTYLTENFNYDPSIDTKAFEYSQTLDKYADGRWNFKPRQNLMKCILENINYKMLIPNLTDESEYSDFDKTSFIDIIYDYEFIDSYEIDEKITQMLIDITEEESEELIQKNVNIQTLVYLSLFHIHNFPNSDSIHDIANITYIDSYDGYTANSIKLANLLYDFKEFRLILAIKDKFNISTSMIIKSMDENFYDYSTYSVGDTNSDMREEFDMYYSKILKPYLLSDTNDKRIEEKIEKLKEYTHLVDSISIDTKIFKLALDNPSISSDKPLQNIISNKLHREFNKLKTLPSGLLNNMEYQMIVLELPKTKLNIKNMMDKLLKGDI